MDGKTLKFAFTLVVSHFQKFLYIRQAEETERERENLKKGE